MKKPEKPAAFAALLAAGAACSTPLPAQSSSPPATQVREAMEKLSWLEGEWRGEGRRITQSGEETFNVAERVEFHVDGIVLLLHGRGWRIDQDGNEVEGHNALGVLSYDAYAETYRFNAFVKEGYQSRSTPEVGVNEYRWSHPAGPNTQMRYHARLSKKGEWIETGERCVEDDCAQFMEMRLKKTVADH